MALKLGMPTAFTCSATASIVVRKYASNRFRNSTARVMPACAAYSAEARACSAARAFSSAVGPVPVKSPTG